MPNTVARALLFLSSYFPLFVIFGFLQVGQNLVFAVSCFSIGVIGLGGILVFLRVAGRLAPTIVTVSTVNHRDGDAIGYIVTYLLPFLSVSVTAWEQWVAILAFFVVIGVVYVNSDMIHLNPLLSIFGYHLYEIVLEEDGSYTLVAKRRRLRRGAQLTVISIGEYLLMEK